MNENETEKPTQKTLRECALSLSQAGHDFWKVCQKEDGSSAVRWLELTDGTLIVFTRGEYRQELLNGIDQISGKAEIIFEIPEEDDEEIVGISAFKKSTQPDSDKKDQWQIVTEPEAPCGIKAILNGHEFEINSYDLEYGIDSVENDGLMTKVPSGTCVLKIGMPLLNNQVTFIEPIEEQS
jgi:hypothetical protein